MSGTGHERHRVVSGTGNTGSRAYHTRPIASTASEPKKDCLAS